MNSSPIPPTAPPEMTGNMLVMFEPRRTARTMEKLVADVSGAKLAHSSDFRSGKVSLQSVLETAGALNFDRLGITVMKAPEGEVGLGFANALRSRSGVEHVRPEFWMYALNDWGTRHAAWVREGLALLAEVGQNDAVAVMPGRSPLATAQSVQQPNVTWGLVATGTDRSRYTGKGIRVAVLDTGFDLSHPDFTGRTIVTESFVPGEDVRDVQGHGTHCIGTACGPVAPAGQARYGIAHEADIYVGKVLNNSGSGREGWIIAGMEWAVDQKCEVISMSLGRAVQPGEPPDPFYERTGQYALDNGSLIIAAAGNESWRQFNIIKPVGAPANSTTIMAVGAVDSAMAVARFSCGGLNPNGGEVNVAGPGVDVLSSFPLPRKYERLDGTSMATPHVAGLAALMAQSDSTLRARTLWEGIERTARDIGLPARDGGPGLAMAP